MLAQKMRPQCSVAYVEEKMPKPSYCKNVEKTSDLIPHKGGCNGNLASMWQDCNKRGKKSLRPPLKLDQKSIRPPLNSLPKMVRPPPS